MAVGGFTYYVYDWMPQENTRVDNEAALNEIITWMTGFTGWSVSTALTIFGSSSGDYSMYYWIMQHTSGAKMVWTWTSMNVSTTMIHSTNDAEGVTRPSSTYDWGPLWVAYLPAGHTPLGAGDPLTASWLPSDGFLFTPLGSTGSLSFDSVFMDGGAHRLHAMIRGDEVIFALARDFHLASTIDSVMVASGTMFDKLVHASHSITPDSNTQGQISFEEGIDPSDADRLIQGFQANGNRAALLIEWLTAPLTGFVNDREPFTWVEPIVYVSNADLDTYGIVTGNGLKGTLNPEIMRVCSARVPEKNRLDSGNLIHLGSGLVVGYDSANGALT